MRKPSGKVEAVPTSNLVWLNNIWYTQQVGSMHGMKPAGFVRYLDDTWPVGSDIWVIWLYKMEQGTTYLGMILT